MRCKHTHPDGVPVGLLAVVVALAAVAILCKVVYSAHEEGPKMRQIGQPEIYIVGTQEYEKKCKTFKIKVKQARELAEAYVRKNGPGDYGPAHYHFLIIDDEYLFTPMYGKDCVLVYGYFVDGHSGRVSAKRQVPFKISFARHPELRNAVEAIVASEKQKRKEEEPRLHRRMDELFGKDPTRRAACLYNKELVPQLIPFLDSRNPDSVLVRACALAGVHRREKRVASHLTNRVVSHLTNLLDHRSVEVREAAFWGINSVGIVDSKILERCLKELSGKGTSAAELPCVQILGYCNRQDERIVTALIATLQRQGRRPFLYKEILEALGRAPQLAPDSGARLAVPVLISVLRGELVGKDNASLRYQAANSLGEIGTRTPGVVDALVAGLADREPLFLPVVFPDNPMLVSAAVYATVAGASAEALRKIGARDRRVRVALEEAFRNAKVTRTDMLAIAGCLAQMEGSTEEDLVWQVISDCLARADVYNRSGKHVGLPRGLGFGERPAGDDRFELRHCQFEALKLVTELGKTAARIRPRLQRIYVSGNPVLRAQVDLALRAVGKGC